MNVEDIRHVYHSVYEGEDAFVLLYQLLVSQYAACEMRSFACLTVSAKASWVQGRGSYAVLLLFSPLVSLYFIFICIKARDA